VTAPPSPVPGKRHVLWHDPLAMIALMLGPGMWFFFSIPFDRSAGVFDPFMRPALVALTPVWIGLLWWRLARFRGLFRRGVPGKGVVTAIHRHRGGVRVDFRYDADGRAYRSWVAVNESAATERLVLEQEVDLLVHPARPGRATIPGLYRLP
jgi:hypothetical protein